MQLYNNPEEVTSVTSKETSYEFLFVALGGALGAVARYAISLIPVKTGFPVLTLITNIIGAVLIGFIVGVTSISLEAFNLFDNKQYTSGGIYSNL